VQAAFNLMNCPPPYFVMYDAEFPETYGFGMWLLSLRKDAR